MDDSMGGVVLAAVREDLERVWEALGAAEEVALETAEGTVRDGVLAITETVGARREAVLGDGATWIWVLAAEHFPGALHIVDWFHASERIWALGRARFGAETPETATWVEQQVGRLAQGQAATLAHEWAALPARGEAATVRDEHVTSVTNHAPRMAYDQYRAAGWDIGSGMVESACKHLIAAREKGTGIAGARPAPTRSPRSASCSPTRRGRPRPAPPDPDDSCVHTATRFVWTRIVAGERVGGQVLCMAGWPARRSRPVAPRH